MTFREDSIRRHRIPWDVRALLHDLCWHMDKTPVEDYVRRARAAMMAAKTPKKPKRKRG